MLKRNSEACLHYFIVPFDLSKAELFASRSETIEERDHRRASAKRIPAWTKIICLLRGQGPSKSKNVEKQKCRNKIVTLAFTILVCHLIDLKRKFVGKCYLLRGQRLSKSENIEEQKCRNGLVKLAFTILLCHLIDLKRNFLGKCYLLRGQRPSKSEREANPSVTKDYLLASRSDIIE